MNKYWQYAVFCCYFYLFCFLCRRAFVTPRILQQQQKIVEDPTKCEEDDEEEIDEGGSRHKADMFIENPADVRERFEQRRQDQRRGFGGRSRAGFPRSDVVGMTIFTIFWSMYKLFYCFLSQESQKIFYFYFVVKLLHLLLMFEKSQKTI